MTEESLFLAALEYPDLTDRAAFLRRACPDDSALVRRVESLLDAHDRTGDLPMIGDWPTAANLPSPTALATRADDADGLPEVEATSPESAIARTRGFSDAGLARADEVVGNRIGPYTLARLLGEGGMGIVFEAHQEKPVRRKVALKVIKAGMDTLQVVSRFDQERQTLAIMDHPGIARVLEAGATDAGRPFFVMELVDGEPITEYCDRHRLSTRRRVELMVPVCQAVQHAHQKGIVHRDLKPSNVLVVDVDGRPVPKVIDFGIAKAIDPTGTERTLFTQQGVIVGTPRYMSPEQAGGEADVDTRSDVYALGVLLYELLTGSTPLGRDDPRRVGYVEMLRRVREEEPPRPSTRLGESADLLATISAARDAEPSRLARLVRGELDWIAMKALEKDRSRRYGTAADLAADLGRHLDGHAVEAGPPSRAYRLAKFARRHRAGLATAAAFALLLVAATAFSAWQAVVADRARRDALAAKQRSDQDRAQAEAVSDFLVKAFRKVDPRQDGRELKVVDLLDGAASGLGAGFKGSPEAKVALLIPLGDTNRSLGLYERSVKILEEARRLAESTLGPDHPQTLRSSHSLAWCYLLQGRLAEALPLIKATLKARERTLGPDHLDVLQSRAILAHVQLRVSPAEALGLYETLLKDQQRVLGLDHLETLATRGNLASAYERVGRTAEALALFEATLKIQEATLGPDHPDTLGSRLCVAMAYDRAGKRHEALPIFESAFKAYARVLGPMHPDTMLARDCLAGCYMALGRKADALRLRESLVEQSRAKVGSNHPDSIKAKLQLGVFHRSVSNFAVAISILEEAVDTAATKLGPDDPQTLECRRQLDWAYLLDGQQDLAFSRYEKSLSQSRSKRGPDDDQTIKDLCFLVDACMYAGKLDRAIELCRATKPRNPRRTGGSL